jgi:hypothetical protein
MTNRLFASMGAPAIVSALAWLMICSGMGAAQAPPQAPGSAVRAAAEVRGSKPEARKSAALPRTPWGDPDLQGTWTSEGELGIPFERSAEFGTRQLLTDEEFVQRQRQAERQLQTDNSDFDLETADISNAGQVGSATSPPPHWLERGTASRRTSIVIDPPDGRIPPTKPQARRVAPVGSFSNGPFNGPEDLSMWDRCITRTLPGVTFPTVYNANSRMVQGPGYVAITYEMIHDTRIIPITQAPHISPAIRQYFGDSRGRWEGNTLVVDVTNFSPKNSYRGSGDALHLIERFTRVDAQTMRYEVTIDDPGTWTRPWTAALDMKMQPQGLFEYACHEGNYGMLNMLSAARAAEKASR